MHLFMICDELEKRAERGEGAFPKGAPHVLFSGCPVAVPNWKPPWIIETSGAVIVGEESCVRERGTRNLTDGKGDRVEVLKAQKDIQINSMCTVFAESEVTSLVAKGRDRRDIALGLHRSVVRRAAAMLKRVSTEEPILFAGGVARNPCMRRLLEEALGKEVLTPEDPQMVGALGAALLAGGG